MLEHFGRFSVEVLDLYCTCTDYWHGKVIFVECTYVEDVLTVLEDRMTSTCKPKYGFSHETIKLRLESTATTQTMLLAS